MGHYGTPSIVRYSKCSAARFVCVRDILHRQRVTIRSSIFWSPYHCQFLIKMFLCAWNAPWLIICNKMAPHETEWIKISALDCKINNLTTKKNKNSATMYTVYIIYHVANPEWYSTTLLQYYIVSSRQTIYCWFRWRYWLTTKKSSKLVSGQSTWPMTSFPPPWISLYSEHTNDKCWLVFNGYTHGKHY